MKTAAPPILAALLFAGLFTATVTPHTRVSTRLSWKGDVERILAARCTECHQGRQPSTVPDFSQYGKARPWARAIRQVILDGHGYSAGNGRALTPFERELLVQWIDGGAPEQPGKSFPVEFSRLPDGYTRLASPDPLKTLAALQAQHGGTRTIIPGLGLALRAPGRIFVIDRGGDSDRVIARGRFVPSLAAHLAALPASTPRARLSDAAYAIGPATSEPRHEVAEVTPDGPDRFWCQMHPDVRSPAPGTCRRCAMTLVEIPPMSLDSFSLDFERVYVSKADPLLMMRLTRGTRGRLLRTDDVLTVHERRVHVFVVDERLRFFAHVHPPHVGVANVGVDLPSTGRYRVMAEFAPVDALPQMRMAAFEFSGPPSQRTAPPPTLAADQQIDSARAGRETRITFALRDAHTGRPPLDLEPYLGAAAHLFVIDEALENPMHAHPIDVADGGLARPAFDVRFPRAGRYVMWLQVQRAGTVETLRFTATVSN